ncbi:EpsG family protein, partial [Elizabethkingia anophelis]|uniref:EpsG family protein n=1 Tax=Elizabethkingia anophelis TaxID=1117645 RepID=UPI0021A959EB
MFKSEFSSISFIYIIFIFSLIAFTQYSTPKDGDYDMVRYYTIYDILADTNWKMAIAVIFRLGDVFFYFIEFLLTRIFPRDPRIMAFFFTFVISLNNYFAINYFLKFVNGRKFNYNKLYIALYFLSFFLILNYPNMTNAYRQFFAMSLFFLALSRKLLGKKYIFLLILSIFSHWSMLIYLIIFILVKFLKNNTKFVLIGAVIINISINYLLPLLPFFGEKISTYTAGEEILGIDKAAITVNILVQILLLCYMYKRRIKFYDYFSLLLTLLSYSIIFLTNSTIITRHFFFVTNFILVVV